MHFSCLLDLENQPSISTALRPLVGKSDPVKKSLTGNHHTVVLLVVQFFVSLKVRLNYFDKFFEQVFVFHGKEFLDFLAVLFRFDNLHDIEIDGFLFLVVVAMLAFTVAFAIMSFAQYNVFFTVVEEIAHDFQQDIVPILIDAFDEIPGFIFGGYAAQRLIVAVQRYRPTFFACFPSPLRVISNAVSSQPAAERRLAATGVAIPFPILLVRSYYNPKHPRKQGFLRKFCG